MFRRPITIIAYLAFVALASAGVWAIAFTSGLGNLAARGDGDLSLASDRLTGQLQRFRELAVILADHPVLVSKVATNAPSNSSVRALLRQTADKTGTREILLLDARGELVAASDPLPAQSLVASPYVIRALTGALGAHHSTDPLNRDRLFSYAAPIFGADGPVIGVVIVRLTVETIETDWRADPEVVFFTDELGVVFTSNRSELVFQARPTDGVSEQIRIDYPGIALSAFVPHSERQVAGYRLWSVDGGRYLPRWAMYLTRPLPVIAMTGEALINIAPVMRNATLQAAATGALLLLFGAALFVAADRRKTLQTRLNAEAHANAVLESRVTQRTSALSTANTALRREVSERQEAEAALKQAQADLVQAGKLSALGQMSAGISHELNQPLMAIRSFAENGVAFIDRDRSDQAAKNLTRISDLARRMGRIIKNLRAFARQEDEPLGRVDLTGVLDAALELTDTRLERDGITLDYTRPEGAIWVRAGEVRLSQVFINLITNAADAMTETPEKRLRITVTTAETMMVTFQDNGPGIADPDRIFDPFYSTKEVGASEGMGLGLSISYGIVQSFGGDIRGANSDTGAMFTVTLSPWVNTQDRAA
jgi:two-component system C4-dicarboxylate transport sensor histidine kinase DctB